MQAIDPGRPRDIQVRGLSYRLTQWGRSGARPVLLLHGWMDTGTAFAPLAQALGDDLALIGVDWRGFGDSDPAPNGCYWFPDYLADLDALLDAIAPRSAVDLIGHSMGGNVAGLYAGVRPQRVARFVSLEGFGLPRTQPDRAPERYARWLDSLADEPPLRRFEDWRALEVHLRRRNPRLSEVMAAFVARCWGREESESGVVVLRGDAAHKRPNPVLYRLEEAMACWRCITAPTLWVYGEASRYMGWLRETGDFAARAACLNDLTVESLPDTGHALQHERPEGVAAIVRRFLDTR